MSILSFVIANNAPNTKEAKECSDVMSSLQPNAIFSFLYACSNSGIYFTFSNFSSFNFLGNVVEGFQFLAKASNIFPEDESLVVAKLQYIQVCIYVNVVYFRLL
jgi:hypothetical protein